MARDLNECRKPTALTVDVDDAPKLVRPAFELSADELDCISCEAGRHGVPLLPLCTPTTLHMVSTSKHHVRAFRPVLACIQQRARAAKGWRTVPVRIASGSDSARQLLKRVIPSTRLEPEVRVRELRAAAELSRTAGSFSAELAALVRMTERAAERVWQETRLGRAGSREAELWLDVLAAERIVEEELVAWQSSDPALRSCHRMISDADIGPFEGEERHSMIRLRSGRPLTKLGSG